ncbi:phosphoribosylanthranilate isomerase [Dehalobacter sp. DCM]|uniref:phosphoribosylanthranilate isomerase n=1 Tax=Dehalobacter sp. DCM TaxID=2907827 RepID=UPI003081F5BF|nr:phosphoribosylanthranilate isomerase [Dehalobacter sp. DCM]
MEKYNVEYTPKIKICGIRSLEDIAILNEFQPDFAGFVLAPSKRKVTINELKILIASLDKKILPVGVFVNQDPEYVVQAVEAGLQVLQIHGDETRAYMQKLRELMESKYSPRKIMIWKAIRVGSENAGPVTRNEFQDCVDGFIVDKYDPLTYGGTGETFDWNLVKSPEKDLCGNLLKRSFGEIPMILAGGLTENNVQLAMSTLHPYCLDVSSSVETEGRKDRDKIQRFIDCIRSYSPRNSPWH